MGNVYVSGESWYLLNGTGGGRGGGRGGSRGGSSKADLEVCTSGKNVAMPLH